MTRVPTAAPTRLGDDEAGAVRLAVESVLGSKSWVLGEFVAGFETAFSAYVGAAAAVGVGNGTDALTLAMLGLALPPGSAILVPANDGGFASVAALRAGLIPVPMDVAATTGFIEVAQAQQALESAPVPVTGLVITHLHGSATPLADLETWRRARGLALIEDCAQAHGLKVGGQHVGGVGDAATFSFYPTKNLGAVGDGGMVTFAGAGAWVERTRRLRQYGWAAAYQVTEPGGFNSRLDSMQAAILSARLPFLDARNRRRQRIGEALAEVAGTAGLRQYAEGAPCVRHHFVVLSERREELIAHLDRGGIDTAVHYPYVCSQMPGLTATAPRPTPVAAQLAARKLSLPCFAEMTDAEVDQLSDVLSRWSE